MISRYVTRLVPSKFLYSILALSSRSRARGMISQAMVEARVVAVLIQIPTCWQLNGQSNPLRRSFSLVARVDTLSHSELFISK